MRTTATSTIQQQIDNLRDMPVSRLREGLSQEFNSLDAQRESAVAYIASQKNEGLSCVPDRYDDGGFAGGNMDRPALKRLMNDIEAGKVHCVVVYKVDRLSQSLMDCARLMELFDRKGVSLVGVTQQFDTTRSMGRLTILLSFAQFEREIVRMRRPVIIMPAHSFVTVLVAWKWAPAHIRAI
jgi:site-specific DNA recombinase